MTMIDILILTAFGGPIVTLSGLFIYAARNMMREEEKRAQIRKAVAQARRHEAARRKARGTPSPRPGRHVLR